MTLQTPRNTTRPASRRRATWVANHVGLSVFVVVVVALVVAAAALRASGILSPTSAKPAPAQSQIKYLGVYEPGAPNTYSGIEQFGNAVGRQPNLVSYYSGWGQKFALSFAETAESHSATTIVQIDPGSISLAEIAAGKYDPYLNSYATQVAAFKHTVVISFGHEMNGFWEPWGYRHQSPASFIAAWRHIVDVFRRQGASNVTWLWQVNSSSSQTGPVKDWWPGAQYVTWVGVSGYYYVPGNTFANVFTPVVTSIRQFSQAPLLIAETAVWPQDQQVRGIKDLFAGIRAQHDLGLVWFDQHSYGGLYKGENWRLEGDTQALNAFRSALK